LFLKSIEMTGFKSFPEKTQMELRGSVIGVIGPNGSGKSNVADAVRWVLGEQSAKSLRGGMMQDVIFAGTQTRKPRSYCEVSLLFDNSDKRIQTEYSEIEVTRKLYRSGESEYYINRTKCRLKDILDTFRDTGIGKEGYSIIGQGRIDEILSDKSTDRRRVFEEASGIMKYRVRKEEAERKLERTRQNIVRVDDILHEQSFMLEPLKRQSEDASVYLQMAARLKTLDVNLFLKNHEKYKEKIERLERQRIAYDEERQDTQRRLEELSAKLFRQQESARQMDDSAGTLAQKLSFCMAELERIEGEVRLCDERISNNEKDTQRITREAELARQKISNIEQNEKTNLSRLLKLEEEQIKQKNTAGRIIKEMETLSAATNERMHVIEAAQTKKVEAIEKQADMRGVISALEQKLNLHKQRKADINERRRALEDEKAKLESAVEAVNAQTESNRIDSEKLRAKFNEAVKGERDISQKLAIKRQEVESAKRDLASVLSSQKVFSDIKEGFEGYALSVKRLMLAAKSDSSISSLVRGTVADMISVPREFETAIEACLGAALENVIVSDEYAAKKLIEYLRSNSLGRVTFLPLDSLRPRYLSDFEKAAVQKSGVIGTASEIVNGERAQKAVDFLLGRTVIAADMDTAIELMRKCSQAFRTVTLKGDVLNAGGSITGGGVRRENKGLVSRDRREEELKLRASAITEKTQALEKALEEDSRIHDTFVSQIESLRSSLHAGEVQAASLREKRGALTASLEDNGKKYGALHDEESIIAKAITDAENEISRHVSVQSDILQLSETRDEDYRRLEEEYNNNTLQTERLRKQLHEAELKAAELFRESAVLQNDNIRLGLEKQELQRLGAAAGKTLELNEQSDENLRKLKEQLELSREQRNEALEGLKQRQTDVASARTASLGAASKLEETIESTRGAHNEAGEKSLRTSFIIEKTQSDIETAQNRLWDTYQLTYANALSLREDISLAGAAAEAEQIRGKLRELGSVNPKAVEEYAALKERMTSLSSQRDDLVKAEEDLHTLIASLMQQMRSTFRASFERINERFGETFSELFDGGRAKLAIEEGEDIMECNIEIIAEPPGKKLQKISLLSGGEKALTAISLLFALLKINPSPVCVLDEIDAALDEINVRKFAEYLEKHASVMQFIVITHRKPTMAVCGSLFGFAMEEKGVSKLLSVRLDKEVI